ncbi:MAG: DNA alkylation repair protein [Actinobacteria bacterium]|nr:DNA alkylation repair protein [Actinomycetota bacterium]
MVDRAARLTSFDAVAAATAIGDALAALGRPDRAIAERAYLKSDLDHVGTTVPDIRRVVKRFLRHHPDLTHAELVALADELWSAPLHERRVAAVELLMARPRLLAVDDLAWIETLLRDSHTWALVDPLAGKVVARVVDEHADGLAVLDRWVTDDDFWIRRSAVLALNLALRDGREVDRFVRYADLLLPEREFFIRKVLGWVARELGKRQPDVVSAWLGRNLDRMNHVTLREAVKYLPDGDQIVSLWRRNKVG